MKKNMILFCLASTVCCSATSSVAFAYDYNPNYNVVNNKCTNEVVLETDAGLIHFDLIKQIPLVSGLTQDLTRVDVKNNSFELADGSKWACDAIEKVNGWTRDDNLVICQNQAIFSLHRYALVNLRLEKAVPITLIREARPTEQDVLYISEIDRANDVVRLNTPEQRWKIHVQDHGTLRNFSEHDRILIGINISDFNDCSKIMPYILINTTKNQGIRAEPVNE